MAKYEYNTAGTPLWSSPSIIPDCFSYHGADVRTPSHYSSASISNFSVGIRNNDPNPNSQTPEWISPVFIPVCSSYQEEHVRNPSDYNPASNSIFSMGITSNYHNNNSVHPPPILDRVNRCIIGPGNISLEPISMTDGFGGRFSESVDANGGFGGRFVESIDATSGFRGRFVESIDATSGFGGRFAESIDARSGSYISQRNAAPYENTECPRMPTPHSNLLVIPPGINPTTLLDSSVASDEQDQPSSPGNDSGFKVCRDMASPYYEDGYKWTKYGKKSVKGSSYIRHYFKCAYSDCQMKKRIVCFQNGQVTKIEYEGDVHEHPKPQQPPTMAVGGTLESLGKRKMDERFDAVSSLQGKPCNQLLKPCNQLLSTSHPNFTDVEYSMPRSIDVVEEEHVLQIISEDDILDDGYRWRKYGTKYINKNPNPRNYYKCTTEKCFVKKYVERSARNTAALIIGYRGKHNHEPPNP